ncbi:MAG: hypothetical protein ACK5NG_06105, partial [Chthoniobacterales bacterium]
MRADRFKLKLSTALVAFAMHLSCTTYGLELHPDEKGAVFESPEIGRMTMLYPRLQNRTGKPVAKLIETRISEDTAYLRYDDGSALTVTTSGDSIKMAFSHLSPKVEKIKVATRLRLGALLGAKWETDKGASGIIPDQKPKTPHLLNDHAERVTIDYATGQQLEVQVPKHSYVQLTDAREWGIKKIDFNVFLPLQKDNPTYAFRIAAGTPDAAAKAEEKPAFILDQFGQYVAKDWPLKISSIEELKADVERDAEYYASLQPPATDSFGGLPESGKSLGLTATGFFHVEKKDDRWYLVDPEGNWFFHLGVCSFQPFTSSTYFRGRESVFKWLPEFDSEYKTAFGQDGGGGKDGQFNYLLANRIRKYGRPHDAKEFTAQMIDRVRKFGFNSTGAFGSGNVAALKEKKFPWIAGINLVPWKGVPFIARQVWDPFDEKTRAAVEKNLAALAANADDPLLIGYFLTNEPLFEDIPKLVASFGGNKASKQELVRMLEKKYKTIEAFNTAWGTDIDSFDTARREG